MKLKQTVLQQTKWFLISGVLASALVGCGLPSDKEDEDKSTTTATSPAGSPGAQTGAPTSQTRGPRGQSNSPDLTGASMAVGPKIAPTLALGLVDDATADNTADNTDDSDVSDDTAATPASANQDSVENSAEDNWGSGNVLYEIYYLIREYDDARDNGVIDGSNIYKVLHDVGQQADMAYDECDAIESTLLVSPFYFGHEELGDHYNCAGDIGFDATPASGTENTYAYSFAVDTDVTGEGGRLLLTTHIQEPRQQSRHAIQGRYIEEEQDLALNQAYLVEYEDGSKYAVRMRIEGVPETGLFTMKLAKGGAEGSSSISISGHGFSKGDNYYLFKVSSQGMAEDVTDAYFCFESETTEDEMKLMSAHDTIPADCADLADKLPEEDYAADGSDLARSASDFTGTGEFGIGLDYE